MDFYNTKQNLIKLASKLFSYKEKQLTKDVDTENMFDHIGVEIHGPVSFSPAEIMELENLDYNKNEQGRDYFSSFLTIAIQAGVYLGHKEKSKEIISLNEGIEHYKHKCEFFNKECIKLQANQMPEGTKEDEILKLREEIKNLKSKNHELSQYKNDIDKIINRLAFDGIVKRVDKDG